MCASIGIKLGIEFRPTLMDGFYEMILALWQNMNSRPKIYAFFPGMKKIFLTCKEWKRVFYIEIMTKVFFREPHCDVVSHWLRRTIMTFSGPDYIIIIRTSCAHQSQISFCHKDSVVIRLPVDNSSILVPGKINFSSPVQFLETLSWYFIIKKDRE